MKMHALCRRKVSHAMMNMAEINSLVFRGKYFQIQATLTNANLCVKRTRCFICCERLLDVFLSFSVATSVHRLNQKFVCTLPYPRSGFVFRQIKLFVVHFLYAKSSENV